MNILRRFIKDITRTSCVLLSFSLSFPPPPFLSLPLPLFLPLSPTRVATIPEKVTPTPTLAKSRSESTPATQTPLKSRNLPYIIEPSPESDSDSFWGKESAPGDSDSRNRCNPISHAFPLSVSLFQHFGVREFSLAAAIRRKRTEEEEEEDHKRAFAAFDPTFVVCGSIAVQCQT